LLKIEGLSHYMGACAAYKRGLEEGWEDERLLGMVEEWQKMESAGKPGERGWGEVGWRSWKVVYTEAERLNSWCKPTMSAWA
jgi:hypothetical protein